MIPGLGALTSLTSGGALTPSSGSSQEVTNNLSTGGKSVGGLTINAKADTSNMVVMGGAAVAVVGLLVFAIKK